MSRAIAIESAKNELNRKIASGSMKVTPRMQRIGDAAEKAGFNTAGNKMSPQENAMNHSPSRTTRAVNVTGVFMSLRCT